MKLLKDSLNLHKKALGKQVVRMRQRWKKKKEKLEDQFLPFNYMQTLYKNLHNLKQDGSADEYTKALYQLVGRVDLNESEEKMVARYISGLKPTIQDVLVFQFLWLVLEAYNRAIFVVGFRSI